jgi:succinyl-diaminopimelate desuccinylase
MMAGDLDWGEVGGVIVAEPTDNTVTLGHKGALWLAVNVCGKSAHGAFPEKGVNAIANAAKLMERLNGIEFAGQLHETSLGRTSLNIGMFKGGMSINSVPDHARFTLDIRTVHPDAAVSIQSAIDAELGADTAVEKIVDVPALPVAGAGPWRECVVASAAEVTGQTRTEDSVAYFTDGSVLAQALGMPPTFILGPGAAARAHTVDEYVSVAQVRDATMIYQSLLETCP